MSVFITICFWTLFCPTDLVVLQMSESLCLHCWSFMMSFHIQKYKCANLVLKIFLCHFWLLDWMTSDYFHSPLLLMSLCGTMARRSIYKHQIHTTFISCSNISRAIMLGIWMNMLYPYKMRMIASVSYSYHKYWFVSVCLSLSYLPIHLSNHPSIPPSNVLLNTS